MLPNKILLCYISTNWSINKNVSKLGDSDDSPATSFYPHLSTSAQPQTWFTQFPGNLHSIGANRHMGEGRAGGTGGWCKGNWSFSNNCTLGLRIHSILSYHCRQPIKEIEPTTPPFSSKLIPRTPHSFWLDATQPVTLNICKCSFSILCEDCNWTTW